MNWDTIKDEFNVLGLFLFVPPFCWMIDQRKRIITIFTIYSLAIVTVSTVIAITLQVTGLLLP